MKQMKQTLRTIMTTSMSTNNHILELWAEMEVRNIIGISQKLYNSDWEFHIFATYASDERGYGISFSYPERIIIDISKFQNLKKLKVHIYNDSTLFNYKMLLIQLTEPDLRDTFSWLCESLINEVKVLSSEEEVVKNVVSRLDKWRNLFDKHAPNGLSPQLQQGLYGELGFLHKLILKKVFSPSDAVGFWVGSEPALRDFQGDSWAVEVKTSAGSNPQGIFISSERQLDESLFDNLFLYHCSLEASKNNGESLPQRIEKIRKLFVSDPSAIASFNGKLAQAGYLHEEEKLYKNRMYKTRDEHIYRIEKDFPRIKENELRGGVGETTYKIILANCAEYIKPESVVFNAIQKHD